MVEAYVNQGRVKKELGQYEAAIADYSQVLRLDSDNVDAYIGRGYCQGQLGRYADAMGDHNQAGFAP